MSFGSILNEARPLDRKLAPNLKNIAPNKLQKDALKSQILVLFELWKHTERNKTTWYNISAESEEHGSKKPPKRALKSQILELFEFWKHL